MGKHKSKADRKIKSKKDRKHKKKSKRSQETSSEDEWVEKQIQENSSVNENISKKKRYRSSSSDSTSSDDKQSSKNIKKSTCRSSSSEKQYEDKHSFVSNGSAVKSEPKRDNWMSLPTSFLTSSTQDRKTERDNQKRLQREREQYNPKECTRELNPYWKNGGDGLPNFKRPDSDEEKSNKSYKTNRYSSRSSNWRKNKNITEHSTPKNSTVVEGESIIENRGPVSENLCIITTEKDLNILAAKLVKAEILGNTKLINELKNQLENARNSMNQSTTTNDEEVILTHTDSKGRSQPVRPHSDYNEPSTYKKKKKVETHKDGERVRYFADDDKYSLQQMFENEKYNSVEDQNKQFLQMTSKISKQDELDDLFSDNIRKGQSDLKIDARNRDIAINEHKKVTKSLDNCNHCIQSENMPKHLMISMGETVYLSLPSYEPLTEGHCLITPIRHVPCSTQLDENEWADILDMRRSLVNLFESKSEDVIFFEYAMSLHKFPHMFIECIPVPKEDGDMAPIYFRKAIDESEEEWSQNKKLVSLKGRDVRKAIPRGLPYFFVSFGMEEGFAHVIEDEELFPNNFAQEVIGGMLDVHHSKWRRPKTQQFKEQSRRVLEFSKEWTNFDCTAP